MEETPQVVAFRAHIILKVVEKGLDVQGLALDLLLVITLAKASENVFSQINKIGPASRQIHIEAACQKAADCVLGIVHIGHQRDDTSDRQCSLDPEAVIGYDWYSFIIR